MSREATPLVIGIGGGKGGVGKSLVAANLSIAIAGLGFRTVLVDADLGASNQHTLFGIDRPGMTLDAFLTKKARSLEEVVSATGAQRLFLVPGVGGIHGAANLPHATKLKLIRHIRALDAEVVVIDVGAGVAFNVLDLFDAGDLRIVVTTPQLTAMQNAYCFLKAAVHRALRKRLENHAQREAFAEACARIETERIGDLRVRARQMDVGLEPVFDEVTAGFATRLVGNMLETPQQRQVVGALTRMARDFLDVDVPVAATLPMSRVLHESVSRRRPFLLSHPAHAASAALRRLAEAVVTEDVTRVRALRAGRHRGIASEPPPRSGTAEETLFDYLRNGQRVEVRHAARVHVEGRTHRARVVDLSQGGLMIEGDVGAEVGDRIEIRLVGLRERPTLRAVVRHVSVSGRQTGAELTPDSVRVASRLLDEGPRTTSTLPPAETGAAEAGRAQVPRANAR